ncbi:hypothetical protein SH611_04890 [Geminicoccaceae bacterium 1502E]|nr:hypothetical protein [Geminicoccaceae bacterium 1502E]
MALPASVAGAAAASVLPWQMPLWKMSSPAAASALVVAIMAPHCADVWSPEEPARSLLSCLAAAAIAVAFLAVRTPEITGSAGVAMAVAFVLASWLVAWVHRASGRRRARG